MFTPKTTSNLRSLKWTLTIVLFCAYSIISINKSWNDDFRAYYQAGQSILSRANIYDPNVVEGGFLYSPFFALLMFPLSIVSQPVAATFWYIGNVVALIFSIAIALYLNEGATQPIFGWIKRNLWLSEIDRNLERVFIFVLIISARFWLNSIEHGQVNLLVWGMVLAAIYFLRSDRTTIGSAILSMSIAIKILPLLFLFYFFVRKRYGIVAWSLGWLAIFTLVPALILGWHQNLELLIAWYQKILGPNFEHGAIGVGDSNQSFPAMLIRFLSNTPANEETGSSVNFLSLAAPTISVLTLFLPFVFLAVIARIAGFQEKKTTQRENLELSIVFLSAVLMPVLAWKAYFVASIMGYTTIIYIVMKTRYAVSHHLTVTLMIISFILHTLTADGIWGWKIAHMFQSYSCVTFAMLFLYAALIMMLIRQRTETVTAA